MQNFILMFLRFLIIRRNQLQQHMHSQMEEERLCELNDVIELLQDWVEEVLSCQPELNQSVLRMYYIELYSWKDIMNKFNIEKTDIRHILYQFQDFLLNNESDFEIN